jgi:lactoylglutathione lyase
MRWLIGLAMSAALFAADPPRPKILGLARASFYVTDITKARAFYQDFLGFAEIKPVASNEQAPPYIKINESQYVELRAGQPQPIDKLDRTAFYTESASKMRAYLASKGVKVPAAPVRDPMGDLSFAVVDPDGHTIEFVEYLKDSATAREQYNRLASTQISVHMTHAGVNVGSLSRAEKFYVDILGFRETWRGSNTGEKLSWINLRVPDGEDYIEFMLYDTLPAENQRGSRHHICLVVPEMKAAVATLEQRSAKYAGKIEPKVGINRRRQLNLFDPDGTRTELMEPDTIDGVPTPSSKAAPPIQ